MTGEHDELREWSAAYVLGALEPGERALFQRHLDACPRCQDEVRDFSALPGLLAKVDRDALGSVGGGDDAAERVTRRASERALHDRARLQRSVRRWRVATTLTAAAAVLVAAVALPRTPAPSSDGIALTVVADAAGSVLVARRGWGTHVELELTGLPLRDRYLLLAIAEDGSVQTAATWGATETGAARLTGATSIPLDQLDRILVTSDDPDDVLLTAAADG